MLLILYIFQIFFRQYSLKRVRVWPCHTPRRDASLALTLTRLMYIDACCSTLYITKIEFPNPTADPSSFSSIFLWPLNNIFVAHVIINLGITFTLFEHLITSVQILLRYFYLLVKKKVFIRGRGGKIPFTHKCDQTVLWDCSKKILTTD